MTKLQIITKQINDECSKENTNFARISWLTAKHDELLSYYAYCITHKIDPIAVN